MSVTSLRPVHLPGTFKEDDEEALEDHVDLLRELVTS